MDIMSILANDNINIDIVKDRLLEQYRLIARPISAMDRTFERALSVCLFDNEDEVNSISYTLASQRNYDDSEPRDSYIILTAEIYGITIYIHNNSSEHIYKVEDDCPIVHLIKIKLDDGTDVYLPTKINDIDNKCTEEKADERSQLISNSVAELKKINSLDLTIRQIKSDGNCFFRGLSDQLSGTQEGHLVLRIIITDFMSKNREKFEKSIDREQFSSWEDFIYRMRQDGTFADGTVVVASASLLRTTIIIHQHAQCPVLFKALDPIENDRQIHLAYNFTSLHYDSLCSCDGDKLHIEESDCIFA